MQTFENIDLHMHTTVSDGTDTPAEILDRVREAGADLFSVTDHDALEGCEEILAIRKEEDPVFVTGAEFSCRDEEGRYHILGYRYDPTAPGIRGIVEKGHAIRERKLERRLDYLEKEYGFVFSGEEKEYLRTVPNPGKPHIANLMIRHGYTDSIENAIGRYLNKTPGPKEYLRPEEAIGGILSAGGIPVLAHPSYGDGGQIVVGEEMDERVRRLMSFGLEGLEAYYSMFTPKLMREQLGLAEKYRLYVTAGSDYHGTNKLVSLLDTGLPAPGNRAEGFERFLAEVLG